MLEKECTIEFTQAVLEVLVSGCNPQFATKRRANNAKLGQQLSIVVHSLQIFFNQRFQ